MKDELAKTRLEPERIAKLWHWSKQAMIMTKAVAERIEGNRWFIPSTDIYWVSARFWGYANSGNIVA